MPEFTGERLIPGEVDVDLWNEHIARYAFAAALCKPGAIVLDAGCGTGYGSRMLAESAELVLATDIAPDAIEYARQNFFASRVRYAVASCSALPTANGAIDLLTAFEVIEHLADWRGFLVEASRVIAPGGLCLISTPNRNYYTESRGSAGANPFHVHEFDCAEFRAALAERFPYVFLLAQNHSPALAFSGPGAESAIARIETRDSSIGDAAFFVAICGHDPIPPPSGFVYLPSGANVLRDRERHIQLLEKERNDLIEQLRNVNALLEGSNRWAQELQRELYAKSKRVVELQDELAREQREAAGALTAIQNALDARTEWAHSLDTQLAAKVVELSRCVDALHQTEATVAERTQWALALQKHNDELTVRLEHLTSSAWLKVGRATRLGPR